LRFRSKGSGADVDIRAGYRVYASEKEARLYCTIRDAQRETTVPIW